MEWNRTEADWPEDVLLHEPFREQARRHPEAVAVIAGSERLSYGELAARAGRLARRLRALGVGPEDRVGIFLERTPRLLVALLAVLEAGGAYVPLDPAHPRERLETILADAGASVLVTEETLLASIPRTPEVRILRADQEEPVPGGNLPDAPVRSGRLAYLIYTSGSTGRPKGVAIEHRSAAALVSWARETFRPGELARVLASTSVSFDLSVFEIFAPLSCGGAVVLAENALALPGLPAAGEVTLLNTVPSAMAELLRQGAVPESVRTVNLAGEPLRGALARDILELGTVTRLLNLYGPSEDTTYSTLAQVDGEGEPTIGRPIPNTRAYLLDAHLQPVEVGIPGELHLAGRGLARGYLGRPDLTAERFLPDPFGEIPGARLYRTGDLARYLRDGQLEFLGRLDHQVKVRGFRIELGEVEAALLGHPSLRDAAVLALGEGTDRRLVAYAVAREGTDAPDLARLRTFLQGRLPDFMLPSALVLLEALPLTPNGKVDRRALAAIGIEAGPGEARTAPRTPVEELLAGIWADVLRRDAIGARDDFFALGGHSLLATRLVSRVREAFGVELPLRSVFEAPTVEALALRIEEAATGLSRPPVGRADRSRPLPLSFAQQRLWFLDRLDPGSPVYNLPERVRLRGALNGPALAAALREVVRRHEALRTTFALVDGEPVQVVHPEVPVPLPRVDLSDLSDPGREILRLSGEEARRGFDLALGPLLRATLLAVGEEEHVLFLTLHHVVADGWSMPVLVREVGTLYHAFTRGLPSPLPELPVQYADFAAWQRRWLAGEVLERELAYWRGQLGDAPPVLDLPADRPRPPIQTFPGSHRSFRLPPERLADLQALSRRSGTTLFMTLLAAFQALLAHHSGQDDLTVGTPIAGRNQLETEGLIGFFVNTLVLRGDLSDAPTVRELLARTRETALAAYGHQDVPFEKLVEDLQPARSLAHAPLFQVMFVLQNVPPPLSGEGTGLALEPLAFESDVARFDLTLSLAEIGGGLVGALEYNTDLFDDTAMERMAGHLRLLFEALPGDPGRRTSDLPWLEEPELAQVTWEWNDTASEPLWDGPVHAAFEHRAEESPGAPALVFEGETTSYGELGRRADRLADYLASLGVGPESRVGVWLEPSPRMIVALLGVHKAGGAYVPLDPAYPEDRLALMLADSKASVLLTEERFLPALSRHAVRRVCLDSGWDEVERAALPARTRVHAGSAAYVIYTSGSTGTPKGVVATHGGLANFTRAMVRSLGLGPGDRMLLFASLSFDASAVQIFPTLASGAALVLHRSARSLTPSEMIALAGETGMTVLDLPVVLWKPLVAHVRSTGERLPATIRRAMTGGEAMADALLRDLAAGLSPEAEVVSSYGPTEATITATVFRIPARDTAGFDLREVPLGRPLPNVRVHLVDRDFWPVPAGVVGEVVIAGAGVTRGYLHQPGLTAERFLPDPWAPGPGARLYRTGDLARALPDGRLQFLGRRDHQVKLRGYRIEPGEIEAAIAALPGVRDQAVTLREEISGDRRLVAWVVPEDLSPAAIQEALRAALPEPMVPSLVVPLAALPLTPSGKLDRRALSRLLPAESAKPARHGEAVPPRTLTELALVHLWQELLGGTAIGVRDNFFELGGHSLLAVRLMAGIRERFGRELPLATLFEAPTIEQLARRLEEKGAAPEPSSLVTIQPRGSRPPLFFVHPIGGEVLVYLPLARHLGPDQPLYGFEAGALHEQAGKPPASIEEMAAGYGKALRAAHPHGPYLLGGWSYGGVVAFEMARQLREDGEEVPLVTLIDAAVPVGDPETAEADTAALLFGLAREQARQRGKDLALTVDELRLASPEGRLARTLEALQEVGAIGREIDVPTLDRFVSGYAARVRAIERYRPRPYAGRIALVRPLLLDPEGLREASPERRRLFEDETLGWGAFAAGVEVRRVPGYHDTMILEPHVRELARVLRDFLDR
ncbi:MAG TPA: amino acid adenylation domain-containing protein [Thermoanaerobaculia bacterium]|nr:amino acid adenylation domain-containing protein [Thermoanaerobaculia bacterium]